MRSEKRSVCSGPKTSACARLPALGRHRSRVATSRTAVERQWVNGWSPEQSANRLQFDFPDDESMRISHEAIYQALYIQGRGALNRELVGCLAPRKDIARAASQSAGQGIGTRQRGSDDLLPPRRSGRTCGARALAGRPDSIGLYRSAIATLVERSTRFTQLVHLRREKGYGLVPKQRTAPCWPATEPLP